MSSQDHKKPAFLKGILWFAFSGTAMLSAFILPVHIFALSRNFRMNLTALPFRMYFFILIEAALYHGLYRTKTILFDLGLLKFEKIIERSSAALFISASLLAAWLFFFTLE